MNNRIANKYLLGENIGAGCFGSVYNGTHYKTNMPVAIKMEDINTEVKILKNETTILKYLYDQGSRDIPIVYWFGMHKNNMCLVMSLYDCSLHDYIQQKPLPPNKIDVIMRTMINIFQSIHSKFVIHRDIKPDNFLMGLGADSYIVYLIDYGLAKKYRESRSQ
jgi:serine/threonine protein kinase